MPGNSHYSKRLRAFACHSCSAKLPYVRGKEMVTCLYCGTTWHVDSILPQAKKNKEVFAKPKPPAGLGKDIESSLTRLEERLRVAYVEKLAEYNKAISPTPKTKIVGSKRQISRPKKKGIRASKKWLAQARKRKSTVNSTRRSRGELNRELLRMGWV